MSPTTRLTPPPHVRASFLVPAAPFSRQVLADARGKAADDDLTAEVPATYVVDLGIILGLLALA